MASSRPSSNPAPLTTRTSASRMASACAGRGAEVVRVGAGGITTSTSAASPTSAARRRRGCSWSPRRRASVGGGAAVVAARRPGGAGGQHRHQSTTSTTPRPAHATFPGMRTNPVLPPSGDHWQDQEPFSQDPLLAGTPSIGGIEGCRRRLPVPQRARGRHLAIPPAPPSRADRAQRLGQVDAARAIAGLVAPTSGRVAVDRSRSRRCSSPPRSTRRCPSPSARRSAWRATPTGACSAGSAPRTTPPSRPPWRAPRWPTSPTASSASCRAAAPAGARRPGPRPGGAAAPARRARDRPRHRVPRRDPGDRRPGAATPATAW